MQTESSPRAREEAGNITVITIGFLIVIGLLVVVVVNASAVFLEHRKLVNVADSIALEAADVVDVSYYQSHLDIERLPIDADLARSQARARVDSDTRLSLNIVGDEVHVRLERPVELWFAPGMSSSSQIAAEARAHLAVLRPAAP